MSQHKFSPNYKMSDLIKHDQNMLLVISRFGLSLGFGNKTVKEVCDANGIDCATFLSVVNFLSEGNLEVNDQDQPISIESVINYLKNAHAYFLDFKLPSIRSKLIEAVDTFDQSISYRDVFLKFFDEYVNEVRKHMNFENEFVFPYVMNLLANVRDDSYNIAAYELQHNEIDSKLAELKNILIKYYPSKGVNHLLNEVLFDLYSCEKDLATHNLVEDYFLVPVVEALEIKLHNKA